MADRMIAITDVLGLDEAELDESFIRASGPGGQNVNKVASAVQLRFDIRRSPSLPQAVRERAERLGGHRVSQDGVIVITAQRYRSQERNRQDAKDRLVALIRRAASPAPQRASAGSPPRHSAPGSRSSVDRQMIDAKTVAGGEHVGDPRAVADMPVGFVA
jgi:ribosome-associated protein